MKEWFLKQFAHLKVYAWPMFMVWNPHTFSVKGKHYYEAKELIRPGDIILRSYKQYLDSYFIPGKYSHAGIYMGDDAVIHAMTPDVQWTDLVTFMRCDKFAIIRPNVPVDGALTRVQERLGSPYDYDFKFEEMSEDPKRKFSCSELVYYAYQEHHEELKWEIREYDYVFWKQKIFAPSDIIPRVGSSAELIYEVD